MLSKTLRRIVFFTPLLFIFHSLEEYTTLYYTLSGFGFTWRWLYPQPDPQIFLVFEVGTLLFLALSAFFILRKKPPPLLLLFIFGLHYVYQGEHIFHTITLKQYYPGLFTGVIFVVMGMFYWKELLKNRRNFR